MSELMGRFREVHVTSNRRRWPRGKRRKRWLQVRAMGNVLTFVDTHLTRVLERTRFITDAGVERDGVAADGHCECFSRQWRGGTRRPSVKKGERKMVWHIFKKDWKLAWGLSWRSRRSTG